MRALLPSPSCSLPTPATPVITKAATGVTITLAPVAAPVTNQVLFFVDVNANGAATFWSFNATAGGTFSVTSGLTDQDEIAAYVVGADYDFLALAPPANLQQTPALPAQADITVSAPNITTYVAASATGTALSVQRAVR